MEAFLWRMLGGQLDFGEVGVTREEAADSTGAAISTGATDSAGANSVAALFFLSNMVSKSNSFEWGPNKSLVEEDSSGFTKKESFSGSNEEAGDRPLLS